MELGNRVPPEESTPPELADCAGEDAAESDSVQRLYSIAMLAQLVGVPDGVIRRWHRRRYLHPVEQSRKLIQFDFEEVRVAKLLAELLQAGCSQAMIDRRLDDLAQLAPECDRPLADLPLIVSGKRILKRRGEDLAEPHGQLLIDFEATSDPEEHDATPTTLEFPLDHDDDPQRKLQEMREMSGKYEEAGRRQEAIDMMRNVLVVGYTSADDQFALAELLYRDGDLSAARERYYAALEIDIEFLEARLNLGCLLAEMGDLELSEAAFMGALETYPDFADAHYHLATLLDRKGEPNKAEAHWREFLTLAPDSPWVDQARDRLSSAN